MVRAAEGPWVLADQVNANGVNWYLLDCRYMFADWIEACDPDTWKLHGAYHRARYWVREDLYTLCLLQKENKNLV